MIMFDPPRSKIRLFDVIRRSGLNTNLRCCLDAGDGASYDGTSQTWTDTGALGTNFNLGTTSGSEATDPTFAGTSGALTSSEYFSTDGGDVFQTTAVAGIFNYLHLDNPVFTMLAIVQPVIGTAQGIMGTIGTVGTGTGAFWRIETTGALLFQVRNAGAVVYSKTSTGTLNSGAWNIVAVTLDETGTGAGGFCINGVWESFTGTYSSPAAGSSSQTCQLMSIGNVVNPMTNLGRMAGFAFWRTSNLTQEQLQLLWDRLRQRWAL